MSCERTSWLASVDEHKGMTDKNVPASRASAVLVLATNPWFGLRGTTHHVASGLASRHQVYYSSGCRGPWIGAGEGPRVLSRSGWCFQDGVAVELPSFAVRQLRHRRGLRHWARALQRRHVSRAFHSVDQRIVYCFHPVLWSVASGIDADVRVYHAYDDYSRQRRWSGPVEEAERTALRRADLVIASSERLAEMLRARSDGRLPVVVPNGVDLAAFAEGEDAGEPDDLHAIPKPRIGYTGVISRKVDFALLQELALARPAYQFVLVGPIFDNLETEQASLLSALKLRRNVHFLGLKPYSRLGRYMRAMDVNVMVYRLDESNWVEASSPLKLYEYLAVGQPIVSCAVPQVSEFSSLLSIAKGKQGWLESLDSALQEGPARKAERRKVAMENSWTRRVSEIDVMISNVLEGQGLSPRQGNA